jgi:hypothetical protein
MVQGAHSEGMQVRELMHELEEARDALQRFEYQSCAEIAERCRRQAEELIASAGRARQDIQLCEAALASARDIGAESGPAGEILDKARSDYSAGDYASAKQRSHECHELLTQAQQGAVWEELGAAILEQERLSDEGSGQLAAGALLEQAGVALAGGDFRAARASASAGRERLLQERRAFQSDDLW